jgi:hypothetical protein
MRCDVGLPPWGVCAVRRARQCAHWCPSRDEHGFGALMVSLAAPLVYPLDIRADPICTFAERSGRSRFIFGRTFRECERYSHNSSRDRRRATNDNG